MRFIGSKANLIDEILAAVNERSPKSVSFCDLFAGTGIVGRSFKKSHKIISNDLMYFSFVINSAYIGLKNSPAFSSLKKELGSHPIDYLNDLSVKGK